MIKYLGGAVFFFLAAMLLVWIVSRPVDTSEGVTVYSTGLLGVVQLGPTCPVQQASSTMCADKPYATTVSVMRPGSTGVYATAATGSDGAFHFELPPGDYTLTAAGGSPLPRCAVISVTVPATGYTNADVSCDTGIR